MVGEIEDGRLLVAWGDDFFQKIIDWLKAPLKVAYELGLEAGSYDERIFLEMCDVEVETTEWDGGMPGMSGTYLYGWIDEDGKEALLRQVKQELVSLASGLKAGKSRKESTGQTLACIRQDSHTFYAPWLEARIRRLKQKNPTFTDEAVLDALELQRVSYQDFSVEVLWSRLKERDDIWETVCRNLDVPATRRFKKHESPPPVVHVGEVDQKKRILVATGWHWKQRYLRFKTFHPEIEKLVAVWREQGGKGEKALRSYLESLGITVEITYDYDDGFLSPEGYDIKAWVTAADARKFHIKRRYHRRTDKSVSG